MQVKWKKSSSIEDCMPYFLCGGAKYGRRECKCIEIAATHDLSMQTDHCSRWNYVWNLTSGKSRCNICCNVLTDTHKWRDTIKISERQEIDIYICSKYTAKFKNCGDAKFSTCLGNISLESRHRSRQQEQLTPSGVVVRYIINRSALFAMAWDSNSTALTPSGTGQLLSFTYPEGSGSSSGTVDFTKSISYFQCSLAPLRGVMATQVKNKPLNKYDMENDHQVHEEDPATPFTNETPPHHNPLNDRSSRLQLIR